MSDIDTEAGPSNPKLKVRVKSNRSKRLANISTASYRLVADELSQQKRSRGRPRKLTLELAVPIQVQLPNSAPGSRRGSTTSLASESSVRSEPPGLFNQEPPPDIVIEDLDVTMADQDQDQQQDQQLQHIQPQQGLPPQGQNVEAALNAILLRLNNLDALQEQVQNLQLQVQQQQVPQPQQVQPHPVNPPGIMDQDGNAIAQHQDQGAAAGGQPIVPPLINIQLPQAVNLPIGPPPPIPPAGVARDAVAAGAAGASGATFRPKIYDPPVFDIDDGPRKFLRWKQDWDLYVLQLQAAGINSAALGISYISGFRHAISINTVEWLCSQLKELTDVPGCINAIEAHVMETANPVSIWLDLTRRTQGENETIDQLNIYIRNQVKHATAGLDIGPRADDYLHKVALVATVRSDKIRKKLLAEHKKTYVEMIELAKGEELVERKNVDVKTAKSTNASQVNATSTYKFGRGGQGHRGNRGRGRGGHQTQDRGRSATREHGNRTQSRSPSTNRSKANSCAFCGKERHDRENCPAQKSKCRRCNKVGHWSHVCRSSSVYYTEESKEDTTENTSSADSVVANVEMAKPESANEIEIGTVETTSVNSTISTGKWPLEKLDMIDITLSTKEGYSKTIQVLPDPGANINLLPVEIALKLGIEQTDIPTPPKLISGARVDVRAYLDTDIFVTDRNGEQRSLRDVRWVVAAGINKALICRKMCKVLGLIHEDFPFVFVYSKSNQGTANTVTTKKESQEPTQVSLGHGFDLDTIANRYPEVFCGKIHGMAGGPCKIELKPEAEPVSAGAFRDIPEAYKAPLKKELDSQVAAGIIEPVDGPSEWLHPIVIVPKKGTSDVRLCVDLRRLNKFCKRPVNPQPTPWEMVRRIPRGAKFFAVFDALKGYHQLDLDENSSAKTTFWTPFGKYRYKKLPMGYAAAQDIFTLRFGNAVDKTLQGFRATEDCLIFGFTKSEFYTKIDKFFAACQEAQITLNVKKIQLGSEVIFAGFKIDEKGYQIDPSLTDALRSFPPPASQTDVRSFMGLANQVCNFTDKIAQLMLPFKELLKKGTTFVWTADHQQAFEKARAELATEATLTYFELGRPTRLFTDASRLNGLGFILKQQVQPEGQWKVVQAGSRFLKPAETRYAMIELELLAFTWAAEKAAAFLEGNEFELIIDHKPLVPILEHYSLGDIDNKRLQRLKMKIDHLQFQVKWVPGKENIEADALSRAPILQPVIEDELDEENIDAVEIYYHNVDEEVDAVVADKLIEELREAASKDQDYNRVLGWVKEANFPTSQIDVPMKLMQFWKLQENLSIVDGLLMMDGKFVVPESLRQLYLDRVRMLHASPTKMLQRIRKSLWWPHMSSDVSKLKDQCRTCVERSPSQKPEPEIRHEPVVYPFQALHMDMGQYGADQYLIMVDQFSNWPIAKRFGREATSADVIAYLKTVFGWYGLPEQIYSDGGPQFKSREFEQMCKDYHIQHTASSPHHPKSNGHAEATVKQVKRLIHCTWSPKLRRVDPDEWLKAILLFRNTPRYPTGVSPSELLFGHQLRDMIPTPREEYLPNLKAKVTEKLEKAKLIPTKPGTKLPILQPGQEVFIQDPITKRWTKEGKILRQAQNNREYMIETKSGKVFRRNRRFLKPKPAEVPKIPSQSSQGQTKSILSTKPTSMPETPLEPTVMNRPARERRPVIRFEDERDQKERIRKETEKRGRKKKKN